MEPRNVRSTAKEAEPDSKAGPVWNGKVRLNEDWLYQPLTWKRPRMIFVCAHGDLFHEDVPDEWIDRVFAVMAVTPWHTFQVLTKRAERMRRYFSETWHRPARPEIRIDETLTVPAQKAGIDDRWHQVERAIDGLDIPNEARFWTPDGNLVGRPAWPRQPLPNVWLGVSGEDQRRADERIPHLLATPARIRFLSAEPLLGPIDLTALDQPNEGFGPFWINALRPGEIGWFADEAATIRTDVDPMAFSKLPGLDWVIVGGESGPGARPMHPQWARDLRDQCDAAEVPFFFKQWGAFRQLTKAERGKGCGATFIAGCDRYDAEAYVLPASKKSTGRLLDGVEHNAMPQPQEVHAL